MIYTTALLLLAASLGYGAYIRVAALQRNMTLAKASGLPYYWHPFRTNLISNLTVKLWAPVTRALVPRKYWESLSITWESDWQNSKNYQVFAQLGEVFIAVSHDGMQVVTSSAEANYQIMSKREAFSKPTDDYKVLNMYGDNIVTTEGAVWRMHRKVTSPSFNERNAALIFNESITQTQGLLSQWVDGAAKGVKTIRTLEHDTMALMLHIIGYAGFGIKMLFDNQDIPADADPKTRKFSSRVPPQGHSLGFKQALTLTLDYLLLLVMAPRWLLRQLPYKAAQDAFNGEKNYVQYMNEFLKDKAEEQKRGEKQEGMDLMGHLVRTRYGNDDANGDEPKGARKSSKHMVLTDEQIVGNAFIMMVAGHETTANTIHFTLVELAVNPAAQRLVQRDIDNIFGKADPKTWDYETNVNALLASWVGASMNETLRTMPPVIVIPKRVTSERGQTITLDGKQYTAPPNAHVDIITPAAHRNPRYWPSKPSRITGADTDIDDWVPERWYRKNVAESAHVAESGDTEDYGGFQGSDTSAQMFRPVRGSFIPFSDGPRSCLGRRIAMVEMIASLSVIFQEYSLELALDEWATDEELARMSKQEQAAVYKKAQDKARATLRGATSIITLKLHGGAHVPVRLVKRGEERFASWIDS